MSAPVMHDSDRMMQRWGLLAACALYVVSAIDAGRTGTAPDRLLHDLGIVLGLAMLGLPVWLPRRFSEGVNAAYAYGPSLPVVLRWQRVGIVLACLLIMASTVVGWSSSPRPVHRALSVGMAVLAAAITVPVWRARRILMLPTRP